jgi:hypothetical protein
MLKCAAVADRVDIWVEGVVDFTPLAHQDFTLRAHQDFIPQVLLVSGRQVHRDSALALLLAFNPEECRPVVFVPLARLELDLVALAFAHLDRALPVYIQFRPPEERLLG